MGREILEGLRIGLIVKDEGCAWGRDCTSLRLRYSTPVRYSTYQAAKNGKVESQESGLCTTYHFPSRGTNCGCERREIKLFLFSSAITI